jgi:hypothetical protein
MLLNGRDAAQRLDRLDNGFIQQRQTVPQDVGLRGPQEQGPLADGERRVDADADQPRLLELDRVAVGQPQPLPGRPLLARDLDVLPFILADGTGGGRLVALGVLRPAGRADEVRHAPASLTPSRVILPARCEGHKLTTYVVTGSDEMFSIGFGLFSRVS